MNSPTGPTSDSTSTSAGTYRPTETAERAAFYEAIEPEGLTALWSVLGDIVTPEPKSPCVPFLWRFETVRSRLLEAAEFITAKEAVRRVLILENPGLRGQSKVTTSLFAGVQLVMPGEVAPSHRYTQSALRFVLEAEGGHTAVGGERTEMAVGDFVITPNWEWHDHGNTSDAPIFWLDGLDIPLVQFLDASFAENLGEDEQPVGRPEGDSLARYGANMLPVGYEKHTPTSPIFNYPYGRSRDALERMRRTEEWDPCHGLKMRYVNPVDGGWAMPTIGAFLQLLPGGFATTPYRSTDATVYVPVEGSGQSVVGGETFEWKPLDIFVVPSWCPVLHEPDELIRISGQWVWPLEVEHCLNEHPDVRECAVLAHELPDRRVTLRAVVRLREVADGNDTMRARLQQYVKDRLLPHKYPRIVEFVADLPKTGTGKIDRQALRSAKGEERL